MWEVIESPEMLDAIIADTARLGFIMASEPKTGSLLRLLAASKPAARSLETGTGTGISAAWLLWNGRCFQPGKHRERSPMLENCQAASWH